MKTSFTILLLTSLVLSSCEQNSCGNRFTPIGKYTKYNKNKDLSYIILKANHRYFYCYKPNGKKAKTFSGKWKNLAKTSSCLIAFLPWKDLVSSGEMIDSNICTFQNDQLILMGEAHRPTYVKELDDPFELVSPPDLTDSWHSD